MMLLSTLVLLLVLVVIAKLYTRSGFTRNPGFEGIFVIPGYPLLGNTFQVLNNPSKTFMDWCKKYKQSTFLIYLGTTPAVVVNSRKDIIQLWGRHSTSLNSRPTLHTFHKVISATQGPTIGTTPAGASFRKKRKFLSMCLSARSLIQEHRVIAIDQSSEHVVRNIISNLNSTAHIQSPDLSLLRDIQCFVLRCAIKMTYGINLETEGKDKKLAEKIIETENHIINFRSFISNYQDYLPLCRKRPFSFIFESDAGLRALERDEYINHIQNEFENRLQQSYLPTSNSLLARIMCQTPEAQALSSQEARSICLTMISAGLDNLGYTMNYIVGQFSSSRLGIRMQERLYFELLKINENDICQAWKNAALFMNCDYALAIIHEALRKFSVLPLGLPRLTTKTIMFKNMKIPKDTVIIMNAYAANHDPQFFSYPECFNPQRWFSMEGTLDDTRIEHLTFGLGSRKCVGDQLSMREMYTLLCRLVLVFHIRKPKDQRWVMDPDSFRANKNPAATSIEPREFRVSLRVRQSAIHCNIPQNLSKGL